MSSDFEFFKNFVGNLKYNTGDNILSLIKTNNYNASVYKFSSDSKNNVYLISYNDSIVKTKQGINILIVNALNNPMYSLMFTNHYFNPKSFNESLSALDMFIDNIKQCLKYKEILNIQTKELYKLDDNDIKYIEISFNDKYDNIIDDIFEDNIFTYNFVSLFLGIKINYWYYKPGVENLILHKKLDVADQIFSKMKKDQSNLKVFNIFDYYYYENSKLNFYTFFMSFKIEDNIRNFFISCD